MGFQILGQDFFLWVLSGSKIENASRQGAFSDKMAALLIEGVEVAYIREGTKIELLPGQGEGLLLSKE